MKEYNFTNKSFFNPIINALKKLGGSAHISEIEEQIISDLKFFEGLYDKQ